MKNKDLMLLAGLSILLYKLSKKDKPAIAGIGNMDDLIELSNKSDGNKKVIVQLEKPTEYEVAKIKDLFGINVSDYVHSVDNYAVRHALIKHSKDTFPISKEELLLIPLITKFPDSIKKGKDKNTNSKRVEYLKKFQDQLYTIEYILEIRTGKKQLAMVTMYKKPAK